MRYLAAGGVSEEGLLQAAALATVVEIGESEDVVTRDRDPIVIIQAFVELRYGVVVHTREKSLKYVGTQNDHSTPHRSPQSGAFRCYF